MCIRSERTIIIIIVITSTRQILIGKHFWKIYIGHPGASSLPLPPHTQEVTVSNLGDDCAKMGWNISIRETVITKN